MHKSMLFSCVDTKQANYFACARTRTAELCFFTRKNKRAGAQTKLFDEKVLVAGDKCTHVPTHGADKFGESDRPASGKVAFAIMFVK